MASKEKKKRSLYDIYRADVSKGFNYPSVTLCSDGDICAYLKKIIPKKGSLTKQRAIEKIKEHIARCKEIQKMCFKQEDFEAFNYMKSRIEGLRLALSYVEKIIDERKKL